MGAILKLFGANVLVEFDNFLIGGIFLQLGNFLSWEQIIIFESRKSAILGIIWTPECPTKHDSSKTTFLHLPFLHF